MKTMTIDQFKAWAKNAQFETETGFEGGLETEAVTGYTDDGEPISHDEHGGVAWLAKTADGITITHQAWVQWPGTGAHRLGDYHTTRHDDKWQLDGVRIVDEDGDAYRRQGDVEESLLDECFDEITPAEIESLIPDIYEEEIDMDTDTPEFEEFIVTRDGDADIRFKGKEIASASSRRNGNSNENGRWTVLKLYRTPSGKLICAQIGYTQWQGENDRFSGAICATEAEVIAFFGHGRLAKDLYAEAGIDAAINVD